jgi:hypothetical protein
LKPSFPYDSVKGNSYNKLGDLDWCDFVIQTLHSLKHSDGPTRGGEEAGTNNRKQIGHFQVIFLIKRDWETDNRKIIC